MTSPVNAPAKKPLNSILDEFKESSIADKIFLAMLVLVPVVIVLSFFDLPALLIFILTALAIIPMAKIMSDSTEALAHHTGETVGGLLSATFGNAVELIILLLALFKGLNEVVKASITGSLLGNILLLLGISMFLGGIPRQFQSFSRIAASISASQLFLAGIALIIPATFTSTISGPNNREDLLEELSLLVGGILLVCYLGQLLFFLKTHSNLSSAEAKNEAEADEEVLAAGVAAQQQQAEAEAEQRRPWSVGRALITLVVTTIVVGYVSEILVNSIEPVTKSLGWTELFVGVIFLAIIGNAAEYVTAINAALKNRMDLSINIAVGASLQVAFFVVPVLVIVGFFSGHLLSLRFEEFELVCIVVAVIIVNLVALDGKSNWFEGLQLIAAYAIIAVAFFLHP
jgi:Ca2+:H+ antiporter